MICGDILKYNAALDVYRCEKGQYTITSEFIEDATAKTLWGVAEEAHFKQSNQLNRLNIYEWINKHVIETTLKKCPDHYKTHYCKLGR